MEFLYSKAFLKLSGTFLKSLELFYIQIFFFIQRLSYIHWKFYRQRYLTFLYSDRFSYSEELLYSKFHIFVFKDFFLLFNRIFIFRYLNINIQILKFKDFFIFRDFFIFTDFYFI